MRRPISPTREAPHAVPYSMSGTCPTADPTAAAASHGGRRRAAGWEGQRAFPPEPGPHSTVHPTPRTCAATSAATTNVSTVTVGAPFPDVVVRALTSSTTPGSVSGAERRRSCVLPLWLTGRFNGKKGNGRPKEGPARGWRFPRGSSRYKWIEDATICLQ